MEMAPDLLEGLFIAAANLSAKCEAACSMLGRDTAWELVFHSFC